MKKKTFKYQYNDAGLQGDNIFNFIALRYKEISQTDKALQVFKLALSYYPLSYNLVLNTAGLYLEKNDKENAIFYFKNAKEIEDDAFYLEIADDNRILNANSICYEQFSDEIKTEISRSIIHELQFYYKVSTDSSHIFYFLGIVYYQNGLNFFALLCFLREIKLNKEDKSDFASFSKIFLNLVINKLTDVERVNLNVVDISSIIRHIDRYKEELQNCEFEGKHIHYLQVIFALYQLICEYLNSVYGIKLDDESLYSILELSNHDLFKISNHPKILEIMDIDKVIESHENISKQNILDILLFYENFINYNLPLITFPNVEKIA